MITIYTPDGNILTNKAGQVISVPENMPGFQPVFMDFYEWKQFYKMNQVPQGLHIDDLGYHYAVREKTAFAMPKPEMRHPYISRYYFGSCQFGLNYCQPIPRSVFVSGALQVVAEAEGFTVYTLKDSRFALTERQRGVLLDDTPNYTQLLIRLHGEYVLWDETLVNTLFTPEGREVLTHHQNRVRWPFFTVPEDRSVDIEVLVKEAESVVHILKALNKPIQDFSFLVKMVNAYHRSTKSRSQETRANVRNARLIAALRVEPEVKELSTGFELAPDSQTPLFYGAFFGGLKILIPLPDKEVGNLHLVCCKDSLEFFIRADKPLLVHDFSLGFSSGHKNQILLKCKNTDIIWGVAAFQTKAEIVSAFAEVMRGAEWMIQRVSGGGWLSKIPEEPYYADAVYSALKIGSVFSYQFCGLLQEWRMKSFLAGDPIPADVFHRLASDYSINTNEVDSLFRQLAVIDRDGKCQPPIDSPDLIEVAGRLRAALSSQEMRCPLCNCHYQLSVQGLLWHPITMDSLTKFRPAQDVEVSWNRQSAMVCRLCNFKGVAGEFEWQL